MGGARGYPERRRRGDGGSRRRGPPSTQAHARVPRCGVRPREPGLTAWVAGRSAGGAELAAHAPREREITHVRQTCFDQRGDPPRAGAPAPGDGPRHAELPPRPRRGGQAPQRGARHRDRLLPPLQAARLRRHRHPRAGREGRVQPARRRGDGARRPAGQAHRRARGLAQLLTARAARPQPRGVRRGRRAGRHDPGGFRRRAHRHRQLWRGHRVPGHRRSHHATRARRDPRRRGRARRRSPLPARLAASWLSPPRIAASAPGAPRAGHAGCSGRISQGKPS